MADSLLSASDLLSRISRFNLSNVNTDKTLLNASELMRRISAVDHERRAPIASVENVVCPSELDDFLRIVKSSEHLNDLLSEQRQRSSLPAWTVFTLLAAYGLVVVVSVLGNSLVVFAFSRMRRLQTFTNAFILNMACSDLLITTLNIPLSLARILLQDWLFGEALCRIIPFVQVTVVYVSSWSMVFIAIDRLRVIVSPCRSRLHLGEACVSIGCLWLVASVAALPYAIYHSVLQCPGQPSRCVLLLPRPSDEYRKWISLLTFVLQFAIPLSITLVCYIRIANSLYAANSLLNLLEFPYLHASSYFRYRKKSIKMLVIVLVVFFVCWLPISLYHLTRDFFPANNPSQHNLKVFLILHWLAMSSVSYNPLIYCSCNRCYRRQARLVVDYACRCLPKRWRPARATAHPQRDVRADQSALKGCVAVRFLRKDGRPTVELLNANGQAYNGQTCNSSSSRRQWNLSAAERLG